MTVYITDSDFKKARAELVGLDNPAGWREPTFNRVVKLSTEVIDALKSSRRTFHEADGALVAKGKRTGKDGDIREARRAAIRAIDSAMGEREAWSGEVERVRKANARKFSIGDNVLFRQGKSQGYPESRGIIHDIAYGKYQVVWPSGEEGWFPSSSLVLDKSLFDKGLPARAADMSAAYLEFTRRFAEKDPVQRKVDTLRTTGQLDVYIPGKGPCRIKRSDPKNTGVYGYSVWHGGTRVMKPLILSDAQVYSWLSNIEKE